MSGAGGPWVETRVPRSQATLPPHPGKLKPKTPDSGAGAKRGGVEGDGVSISPCKDTIKEGFWGSEVLVRLYFLGWMVGTWALILS